MRDGGRRHPYHLLSAADKESYARTKLRPLHMRCPECFTAVTERDLLEHQSKRCQGRGDPHPHGKWITVRQAEQRAEEWRVSGRLVRRWIERKRVRVRADGNQTLCFEADVVWEIADEKRGMK